MAKVRLLPLKSQNNFAKNSLIKKIGLIILVGCFNLVEGGI